MDQEVGGAIERELPGRELPGIESLIEGLSDDNSPLGPRTQWPAELRSTVDLILPAKAEIVLFWGPQYVALYNEAYAPTIGNKHPRALGRPAVENWTELWDDLEPLLKHVRETGQTFFAKDRPFYIQRSGEGETVYFDVSYSPVRDAAGGVAGVLCIVSETTTRVHALRRAAESEGRLQAVADSIDQMIWSTRPDGFHDYYNRRWYEYTGMPDGSTDGELWNGMFHPEDQARAWSVWRHSLSTGEPYHIEYRLRHRSGAYRWVLGRAQPVRDDDGRIVRWYGTCTDIHDLKQAEDALREERNALEILNTVSHRIVAEHKLDDLVQGVVNAGVELSGAQFGAFFYNVLNDQGESYMLYALAGATRADFEKFPMPRNTAVFEPTFSGTRIVRSDDITKDSSYGQNTPRRGMPEGHLPVRSYLAVPVKARSGEVVGGLFFGHGQAAKFDSRAESLVAGLASQAAIGFEKARLVQALQAMNTSLESEVAARTAERDQIWQVSHDLLLIADLDGRFKNVNPAWERVLGWRPEELVGRTSEWLEHPDDRAKTRGEISSIAGGKVSMAFENRFKTRDGDYRVLSWTAVRSGDSLYCVARDVTEERERRQALEQAQHQLRQSQKMETVGQLTGGVAHDFNNLLQIIGGNLDTIARNLPPDQLRLRRAAESAMAGTKRAATLTQRLLAFARRQPLAPKPLDPNKLILRMSEMLHRTLGETVEVETVLSPGIWRIEADETELESAILNLTVNARDAMPRGGKLTIETANMFLDQDYARRHAEVLAGQYVVFSVSDTGSGIAPDALERVFEPFYTTKEVGKGTGLGLSMVYGFVKQSGGHVKIYSEPSIGTTVRLYLPRLLGEAKLDDDDATLAIPAEANAETILVCEDDDDVRAYTVQVLRDLGYRVLEAHDGPSALRLLARQESKVDLLFSDVVLPGGMTGADVAREARQIQPDLQVLFTTGYARNAIVHHGRLDPGVQLLTKPFSFHELSVRLRDILDAPTRGKPRPD